jgi:uncharacterized protein CbrC (UPF0167 family)
MSDYANYPGGESFEPWQDHEWPTHCGVAARYLGEVGERELRELSDGDIESFLRRHAVDGDEIPITMEMVPPHAPAPGEAWDSTIHHFRCIACGRALLLWDAS